MNNTESGMLGGGAIGGLLGAGIGALCHAPVAGAAIGAATGAAVGGIAGADEDRQEQRAEVQAAAATAAAQQAGDTGSAIHRHCADDQAMACPTPISSPRFGIPARFTTRLPTTHVPEPKRRQQRGHRGGAKLRVRAAHLWFTAGRCTTIHMRRRRCQSASASWDTAAGNRPRHKSTEF